jgi:hypothetical protein
MPQFGASLTDDASRVNYDCNMFIIQATGVNITKLLTVVTNKLECLTVTDLSSLA